MTKQTSRAKAFSLIELLVVVSIIALLVAIMLPALGKAQAQGKGAVCKAHLSMIGLGINTYLAEYEYTFPVNGVMFPKIGPFGNGVPFADQKLENGILWPIMNQNKKTYICPIDDMSRNFPGQLVQDPAGTVGDVGGANVAVTNGIGYWSYSVNSVLNSEGQFRRNFAPYNLSPNAPKVPWNDPLKTLNVKGDSNFIFMVEEDAPRSKFNDEVFDAPAYTTVDFLTNRHNNGGHVAFMDRHVEWFSDVIFNNGPSALIPGDPTPNWHAMQYPITRMFFPDGGEFADPSN